MVVSGSDRRLSMLMGVFILSGFSGLIYQSIWSHYLGLFLGHAAYAQALVLAIFMGGMAAGAALVSRVGEGWQGLIRRYAIIEAIIGVAALVFHGVFVTTLGFSYDVVMPALADPALISGYKWLLAGLLILPQTVLLGMTFPLMSGGIIRRYPGHNGHILGGLYFTNSIGAALGVLFAGFLILPTVGLKGAMLIAGVMNLAVAVAAWLLGGGHEAAPTKVTAPVSHALAGSGQRQSQRVIRIVLFSTFLSAAASFGYEIVWIRLLSMAVGSTLHAFELMLAAFIAGIAFGGLWIRKRADSSPDPLRLVGWLQLAMGLAAIVSLVLYTRSFDWVSTLMSALAKNAEGYVLFNLGTATLAMLIMIPAAFFAGTTLPLFTVVMLRHGAGESSIGRVYAWNTVGAILGVFVTMHLLIPAVGLKLTMVVCAFVDIFIGIAILRYRTQRPRHFVSLGFGTVVAVASLVMVIASVPFNTLQLSSGVFRTGKSELPKGTEVLFYRDGKTASVSVLLHKRGSISIATNGKPDAAVQYGEVLPPTSDEPTMVLAGALPMAYLDRREHAAVIGFGSGLTTNTLLADAAWHRVDTIEIEEAMVEGAKAFDFRVSRAYEDPRSSIHIDDAKSYFSSQQTRYDVIISEPSNPWISGVGALFSREFYEFVPRHLADDGVFVQWLQLYEINEQIVGSVLNALTPVFKDYQAYLSNNGDMLIIASQTPLKEHPDYARLLADELGVELGRVGIRNEGQLRMRKVADARVLRAMASLYKDLPVNSDYLPVLSLNAPKTRFIGSSALQVQQLPDLELPFLEVAGILDSLAPEEDPGITEHFARARSVELARGVLDILRGEGNPSHGPELAHLKAALSHWLALNKCSVTYSALQEDASLDALSWFARALVPYVRPAEMVPFLEGEWRSCEHRAAPFNLAADLILAAGYRNYRDIANAAQVWFDGHELRDKRYAKLDPFFFVWWQLALLHEGQHDKIREIESTLGSSIEKPRRYGYLRDLILAYIDAEA